jgi:hypothetical protein
VLAVMVWAIVRGLVETTTTLLVQVNPLVPAGCQVTVEEEVKLHFKGPRGEVESAVTLLKERGASVKLEVAPFPPDSPSKRRDLDARDIYRLPFPERLLESTPAPPKGEVIRLEEGRFVRILRPAAEGLPPDRRVQIAVEPDHLLLDAPAGTLSDEIQPDPIDLKPLLNLPAQPHRVPLTFERWRQGGGDRTLAPEVLRRRASVPIRMVTAVVQVEVTASAPLANALVIMVKTGWSVNEITPPAGNDDGFAGPLVATEASPRLDRVTFTGRIVSSQDVLKDLEDHKDGWRWALEIKDDDLPEPGKPPKEVQARLLFIPLADRFRAHDAQGSLRFEPFNVPVQVVSKR